MCRPNFYEGLFLKHCFGSINFGNSTMEEGKELSGTECRLNQTIKKMITIDSLKLGSRFFMKTRMTKKDSARQRVLPLWNAFHLFLHRIEQTMMLASVRVLRGIQNRYSMTLTFCCHRKILSRTLMQSGDSNGTALIGLGHNDVIDTSDDILTLLGLLHGPGANTRSPLRALCELMLRLDSLPWCLCWTKQRVAGTDPAGSTSEATEAERKAAARQGFSIDLVELPRLGLSFRAKEEEIIDRGIGSGGSVDRTIQITRLYSVDHDGLFVSNEATTDESTQQLLEASLMRLFWNATPMVHCIFCFPLVQNQK